MIAAIALLSCSKQSNETFVKRNEFSLTVPVYEQESVSHYDVEVSTNGQEFSKYSTFPATKDAEFTYSGTVDFTEYFKNVQLIYVRFKAVDIDTKFLYSPVLTVYKN